MNQLTINIPGLSIACKTWGNPEAPPILALHGWLDNANSFDPVAHYLQDQFYFIAIDLPGHGHSSHLPIGANYHFVDGVFTIIEIISALGLSKVHLLGHSLGACLGSLVAGVAPDQIRSLSLIEGLGPLTHPAETTCKQLSNYAFNLKQKNSSKRKGYTEHDTAALARSLKGYVSLEIAKILCERGVVEKNSMFYWRHDQRLLAPSPLRMTEEQVLSCLEQIQAKTYLFWASNGFSFNYELIKRRIGAVKDIRIERLEGGHHIHMEQPRVVAQLLADFYHSV